MPAAGKENLRDLKTKTSRRLTVRKPSVDDIKLRKELDDLREQLAQASLSAAKDKDVMLDRLRKAELLAQSSAREKHAIGAYVCLLACFSAEVDPVGIKYLTLIDENRGITAGEGERADRDHESPRASTGKRTCFCKTCVFDSRFFARMFDAPSQ